MGSGRRRQFIVLDDDSTGKAPRADPSGGIGSIHTPEDLEKTRDCREGVMRRDGEEELPKETPLQIDRRRKKYRRRTSQRHAPERNKDLEKETVKKKHPEQEQEEDVMSQADTATAVPIGDPVSVTGRRGKTQRKHYKSFQYNGLKFDLVSTTSPSPSCLCFVMDLERVACLIV
jgi:hypothetical protein